MYKTPDKNATTQQSTILQNLNDVLIKVSPKYFVVTLQLAPRTICKTVKSPDNYLITQPPPSTQKIRTNHKSYNTIERKSLTQLVQDVIKDKER